MSEQQQTSAELSNLSPQQLGAMLDSVEAVPTDPVLDPGAEADLQTVIGYAAKIRTHKVVHAGKPIPGMDEYFPDVTETSYYFTETAEDGSDVEKPFDKSLAERLLRLKEIHDPRVENEADNTDAVPKPGELGAEADRLMGLLQQGNSADGDQRIPKESATRSNETEASTVPTEATVFKMTPERAHKLASVRHWGGFMQRTNPERYARNQDNPNVNAHALEMMWLKEDVKQADIAEQRRKESEAAEQDAARPSNLPPEIWAAFDDEQRSQVLAFAAIKRKLRGDRQGDTGKRAGGRRQNQRRAA